MAICRSLYSPLALDYLGKVVHAQASTLGFQDGFTALALVFLFAIIPASVLAWTRDRATRIPEPNNVQPQ